MKYFNVGYRSANYYLINAGSSLLAIDVGWPGTLNEYGRALRRRENGCRHKLSIVTRFHPDHATWFRS